MPKGLGPQAGERPLSWPYLGHKRLVLAAQGCVTVSACMCMCESVYVSVSDSGYAWGGLLSEHVSEGSRL